MPTPVVTTLEGVKQQLIIGPVASFETIKHIGTNGGGFFGMNAAHPFENPTPLTNTLHILSMLLIPSALTYTFGAMIAAPPAGLGVLRRLPGDVRRLPRAGLRLRACAAIRCWRSLGVDQAQTAALRRAATWRARSFVSALRRPACS